MAVVVTVHFARLPETKHPDRIRSTPIAHALRIFRIGAFYPEFTLTSDPKF
jgi:hypothetical protein